MDLSGIEDTLGAIFFAISIRFGSHWEISPAEAKKLEQAIARVARHYSFAQTQRMADWTRLMLVMGNVAGPRALQSFFNYRESAPAAETRPPAPASSPAQPPPNIPGGATPPAGSQSPPRGEFRIVTPGQMDPGSMSGSHATSGSMI